MERNRPGVSEEFLDEAMRWLLAIVISFDVALVAIGTVVAVVGSFAGGIAIAALGTVALAAVLVLGPGDECR